MKLTFYYNVSVTVFRFSIFLSVILNQLALHKFQLIQMYSFVIPQYQMYSDHMTSGITQVIFHYVACDDGM
jgi:hypothetical protein